MKQRSVASSAGSGVGGGLTGGAGGGVSARLRAFDIFRKIPKDLTEASAVGGTLSLVFAALFLVLLVAETRNFMAVRETTTLEIDHSEDGIFQVNFNMTFHKVDCDFVAVDLVDVIGKRREDVQDKTVHKYSPDGAFQGFLVDRDKKDLEHLYEGTPKDVYGNERHAIALSETSFAEMVDKFEVLLVDFHAPWCIHCQNLSPIFEHAADLVKQRAPVEVDGHHRHSVALATLDCTVAAHRSLCLQNHIVAFPTILVFRQSRNNVVTGPRGQYYEAYSGIREAQPIADFAISVLKDLQQKDHDALPVAPGAVHDVNNDGITDSKVAVHGCRVDGYLLVKRVPGKIVFKLKSEGHSFNTGLLSMDHSISHLSFGNRKPSEVRRQVPENMDGPYAEKVGRPVVLAEGEDDVGFSSTLPNATFAHYIKVVSTSRVPLRARPSHAFEYTMNSNTHAADPAHGGVPEVELMYDLSALKVVIREEAKPWIEGLTTMCAILGGVYTCSVLFEGLLSGIIGSLGKKLE